MFESVDRGGGEDVIAKLTPGLAKVGALGLAGGGVGGALPGGGEKVICLPDLAAA